MPEGCCATSPARAGGRPGIRARAARSPPPARRRCEHPPARAGRRETVRTGRVRSRGTPVRGSHTELRVHPAGSCTVLTQGSVRVWLPRGVRGESASAPPPARAAPKNSGSCARPRPIVCAGSPEAAYPGRSTAARRQSWRVMRAGRSTSSSSPGRLGMAPPNTAPRPARRSAPTGERMPAGSATVTGASSRSSTVSVWWEMPRWRARGSPDDMRATSSVAQPSASAVCAPSSADRPPWPSGEPEPTIPGPGPHTAASQPRSFSPWCSAPAVVIASPSPPNAAPAVR